MSVERGNLYIHHNEEIDDGTFYIFEDVSVSEEGTATMSQASGRFAGDQSLGASLFGLGLIIALLEKGKNVLLSVSSRDDVDLPSNLFES